jgi:predicted acyl esterase
MPWHPFTRAAKQPVPVNAVTRYDIDVRPTFATLPAGHRLQLTIQTGQTPHLIAFPTDLPNLLGGVYNVQRTPDAASFLEVPLAPASAFASP